MAKKRKLKLKITSLQERLDQANAQLIMFEQKHRETAELLQRHSLEKRTLNKRLEAIRNYLCVCSESAGSFRVCDCKYGADTLGNEKEERSGCPEVGLAIQIIENI